MDAVCEIGCQNWLNGIGVFEPKLAVNFWKAWENQDKTYCENMIQDVEIPFFTNLVKNTDGIYQSKRLLKLLDIFQEQKDFQYY